MPRELGIGILFKWSWTSQWPGTVLTLLRLSLTTNATIAVDRNNLLVIVTTRMSQFIRPNLMLVEKDG